MGSDKAFIFGGRSFMYITKSTGLGIDLWETPCFIVPQSDKIAVPTSHSQLKLYVINSNKTANKIR
jgi:hypothetical protein